MTGDVTTCDPYLVTLSIGRGGDDSDVSERQTLHHVARGESKLTIYNDKPGLRKIVLVVDGKRLQVQHLVDGEVRVVDLSRLMRRGDNTISLEAVGKPGGKALVMLSE